MKTSKVKEKQDYYLLFKKQGKNESVHHTTLRPFSLETRTPLMKIPPDVTTIRVLLLKLTEIH